MSTFKAYEDAKKELARAQNVIKHLDDKSAALRANLENALTKKMQLENQSAHFKATIEKANLDVDTRKYKLKEKSERLLKLGALVHKRDLTIADLQARIERHVKDLNQNETDQSSQEDKEALAQKISELDKLKVNLRKVLKRQRKQELDKNGLVNELEQVLEARLRELEMVSPTTAATTLRAKVSNLADQKSALRESTRNLEVAVKEVDKDIESLSAKCEKLIVTLNDTVAKIGELEDSISNRHIQNAKAEEQVKRLEESLDQCRNRLKSSSLPAQKHLDKLLKIPTKQCLADMKEIEERLGRLDNINFKAAAMHQELARKMKNFDQKINVSAKSLESIEEMCRGLEEAKFSKIEFTFKQVGKYFSEFFSFLVPAGSARLAFNYDSSQDGNNNMPTEISIFATFSGGEETSELNQLSGGQKTIVALAFMFAFQKADPSPVYIFDEVDANLDAASRSKVAQLIQKIKEEKGDIAPQFITTTFRKDLVENADNIVKVSMFHGASKIEVLDRKDALEFIVQQDE